MELKVRRSASLTAGAALAVVFSCLLPGHGAPALAQIQQPEPSIPRAPGPPTPGLNEPERGPLLDPQRLERMREEERRKRLLADTARLVALSNQLQEDVDHTPKDQLSLEVVRKAAEIEKLAHEVRERMKS